MESDGVSSLCGISIPDDAVGVAGFIYGVIVGHVLPEDVLLAILDRDGSYWKEIVIDNVSFGISPQFDELAVHDVDCGVPLPVEIVGVASVAV